MLHPDSPFMRERMQWVEAQAAAARTDPRRKLDLSALPRFTDNWERRLPESLQAMTPGLVVLVLTFGLGTMIAAMRLLRYNPR